MMRVLNARHPGNREAIIRDPILLFHFFEFFFSAVFFRKISRAKIQAGSGSKNSLFFLPEGGKPSSQRQGELRATLFWQRKSNPRNP
jgi:hypothetical protein